MAGDTAGTIEAVRRWFEEIGRTIAVFTRGVTNIKKVENQTAQPLTLWKRDEKWFVPPTEQIVIPARSTRDIDFWIPWAKDATEYERHQMTLALGTRTFAWLWQANGRLKFSAAAGFDAGAPDAPAEADGGRGGGDRKLIVRLVGTRPVFVFARMP